VLTERIRACDRPDARRLTQLFITGGFLQP